MTDRAELERLQAKERACGCVCNLLLDEAGRIDGVYYLDPEGPGRQRTGLTYGPLAFAEMARAKPWAHEGRGPKYRRGAATGLVWPVRCYP